MLLCAYQKLQQGNPFSCANISLMQAYVVVCYSSTAARLSFTPTQCFFFVFFFFVFFLIFDLNDQPIKIETNQGRIDKEPIDDTIYPTAQEVMGHISQKLSII